MANGIAETTWVYVVIQDPGREEKILGQYDDAADITFIPFFKDRDTGQQAVLHLAKTPGRPLEIQAIIFEDLVRYATQEGHLLFLLDASGRIETKMSPQGKTL